MPDSPTQARVARLRDERFMRVAIDAARTGVRKGGHPFGACVVIGREIVGVGANTTSAECDPTAHAEVNAIRQACDRLQRPALARAEIYCTTEPCVMCAAAICWARIGRIVYGCSWKESAALGLGEIRMGAQEVVARAPLEVGLVGPCLPGDCRELLRSWSTNARVLEWFARSREAASVRPPREEESTMSDSLRPPVYRGARCIAENQRVVIWEDRFRPGVPIGPHRHERDYVIVALDPGRMALTDGSGDCTLHEMDAGEAVYVGVPPEGSEHRAVHLGPNSHRELVIELKV